jgi:hypothetical protein
LGMFSLVSSSPLVSNALAERDASDLVVPSILPGSWKYQGCYTYVVPQTLSTQLLTSSRDVPGRTLRNGGYNSNDSMTAEACISYCTNKGFIYAGTEYGSECWKFTSSYLLTITTNGPQSAAVLSLLAPRFSQAIPQVAICPVVVTMTSHVVASTF